MFLQRNKVYTLMSNIANDMGIKAYVVGGKVRDNVLNRENKDIDIVVVGDGDNETKGIEFAKRVAKELKIRNPKVYKNFGTAMFIHDGIEYEFVGARKESYKRNSRKPIIENGTLKDDQYRRDFNMNSLYFSLNEEDFGEILDPYNFGGLKDIDDKLVRSHNADVAFSDDPLRMLRAVRFASQLDFNIEEKTMNAIKKHKKRISIISMERIHTELNKILLSPNSGYGIELLHYSGLLKLILPEVENLNVSGNAHKNNMWHTITVLKNYDYKLSREFKDKILGDELWFKWALLLHDIGKKDTAEFINGEWQFHGHEALSEKMTTPIFRRLKLPLTNDKLGYTLKIIGSHGDIRISRSVTDAAIRRLRVKLGDYFYDMMVFGMVDQSTRFNDRYNNTVERYKTIYERLLEIEEKDSLRNFKMPIKGTEVVELYNPEPLNLIKKILDDVKDALVDGLIENTHAAAYEYMKEVAENKFNLKPVI